MKKIVSALIGFGAGFLLGFKAGEIFWKKRIWDEANDEIRKVKESYEHDPCIEEEKTPPAKPEEKPMSIPEAIVKDYLPQALSDIPGEDPLTQMAIARNIERAGEGPREIDEFEFGDDPDYAKVTLTYYADGVLTDADNRRLSEQDIQEQVGSDCIPRMQHLVEEQNRGVLIEDCMYVVNDAEKTYYEILSELRSYTDIQATAPYLRED